MFEKVDRSKQLSVEYVDSDFAGDLNKRCSTTSYVFMMAGVRSVGGLFYTLQLLGLLRKRTIWWLQSQ